MKLATALLLSSVALAACGSGSQDQPEVLTQPQAGWIPVAMYSNGTQGYQYTINPSFISAPSADVCQITTFDPCEKIVCPQARKSLPPQSAGTLHFAAGTNMVNLVPQFNGYMNIQTPSSFFKGGENLTVKADGDVVPAFSANVTTPSPILITAPLDATLTISQSKDLPLAWTGTSSGQVVLELNTTDANTSADVTIQCHLPANTTSGTIPKAALAQIAQGSYMRADIYTRTRSTVSAGSWSVLLEGQYHAGVAGMGAYKRSATVGP